MTKGLPPGERFKFVAEMGIFRFCGATKTPLCLSKGVRRREISGFLLTPTDVPLGNAGPILPHRRRPADVGAWALDFWEVSGKLSNL